MIYLIDNYDSFTYNLYQYLAELGEKVTVLRNDAIPADRLLQQARAKKGKIVLSPGPGHPRDAGICVEVIQKAASESPVPVLGVCLGHQAIGLALGGKIVLAPKMMHGKTSSVKHDGRGIFTGVRTPVEVTRYHSLMIEPRSLPRALKVSAKSKDGVIMAVRHVKRPMEGVQFHPESILTEDGKLMIRNFVKGKSK